MQKIDDTHGTMVNGKKNVTLLGIIEIKIENILTSRKWNIYLRITNHQKISPKNAVHDGYEENALAKNKKSFVTLIRRCLFLFSEPNATPSITEAYALDPYSAKVKWTGIKEKFWRASVISYKVIYQNKNTKEEVFLDHKGEKENEKKLDNLSPNTTYVVHVLATNSKGNGTPSTGREFTTKSRKLLKLLFGIYIRFVRWKIQPRSMTQNATSEYSGWDLNPHPDISRPAV